MRRILRAPAWTEAVLLVQWEVARPRAGVGGQTMMTAQWSPWFDFELHGRVPVRAFAPRPGVDGGILVIRRRSAPDLPTSERRLYQAMVHRVFTGPGHGLAKILSRNTSLGSASAAAAWLAGHGLRPTDLPKSLQRRAWVDLFETTGASPPDRRCRSNR